MSVKSPDKPTPGATDRDRPASTWPRRLTPPWDERRIALAATIVGAIVLSILSMQLTGISLGRFIEGIEDLQNLLDRMWPPIFSGPGRAVELLLETLMIAVAGTAMAVVISIPVAFLAAMNTSPGKGFMRGSSAFIVSTRAIPDLVFALIFVRALGIGALPGVLAIGVHSVGMVAKLFASAIEEIDQGPLEAARAAGAGRIQAFFSAVVPQVIPNWVSVSLYRLDINVRGSVVLGFVGAGGIGFELQGRLRSLQYRGSLALILLIFVLIVLVERVSTAIRKTLLEEGRVEPKDGLVSRFLQARSHPKTRGRLTAPMTMDRASKIFYGLFAGGLVLTSLFFLDITPDRLLTAGPQIFDVASGFFPPDFVSEWDILSDRMIETVAIGLAATALGVPLAVPLAFLAARNLAVNRFLYNFARYFIVAGRGIPSLVIALVFVSAVGLGPFAGTMALAIGSTFFIAKLFADALEEVRDGPREAVRTTGATRLQEQVAAVFPQVVPSFVGNTFYMFDINIRISTILGIVGGGGIGVLLQGSLRTFNYQLTGAIILAIFIIVVLLEQVSQWVRSKLI